MVLISRCLEILSLWKLACEHQFEVVCGKLTGPQQATLKTSTLKSLLSSGNEDVRVMNHFNCYQSGVFSLFYSTLFMKHYFSFKLEIGFLPQTYWIDAYVLVLVLHTHLSML